MGDIEVGDLVPRPLADGVHMETINGEEGWIGVPSTNAPPVPFLDPKSDLL